MSTDVAHFAQFPRLLAAIQNGIDRRLHTCVQVYVSVDSVARLDAAVGDAAPGIPLSSSDSMLWRSAGKPLTALLILQRIERGLLTTDSTVGELLADAMSADVAQITIQQLLTHCSSLPTVDTGWPLTSWDASVRHVLNAALQLPQGSAAYHPQSSWFLLGEILRQTSSPPHLEFPRLLREELLQPLQLYHSSCGLPLQPDGVEASSVTMEGVVPVMYERQRGELVESVYNTAPYLSQPSPGGGLRGPIRELGRFYELLLQNGQLPDGTHFVSTEMVRQMTQRQRTGQYDHTLQHVVDFGLGVIVNSSRYGVETVPYGFGRSASESAFGHGGSQCAMGFCDPDRQLVVAWAANGFCGEGQHQRRNRAINDAIIDDLNLSLNRT